MTKNYILAIGTEHPRAVDFGDAAARRFTQNGFILTILRGVNIEKARAFDKNDIIDSNKMWVLWAKGEGLELQLAGQHVHRAEEMA